MQINDIVMEWDNLSTERKWNAWVNLVEKVRTLVNKNDFESMESFILDVIQNANDLSDDDYFGTDGLEI